ncbi:MAG: Fic family protein [Alphaproteobacteria bacterium]
MNLEDYHSGQYIPQYEYKSFDPSLINHAWIISDPELHMLLGEANRAIGELKGNAQQVPDIDFCIRMYVAKEATQSSRIEGTQTNIEDAFLEEEDIAPESRDDWGEVKNYIDAINWAIEELETLPLSNRLLKDTHRILMQGVRGERKQPGEFRSSQNWIGVSLKNAVFVPPHHNQVPDLMGDLENFIHDEENYVPHLIKIAIAHYQFETIHPFLDGNGRLGRLMISLYMAAFGLLDTPALYLSDYFERHKTAYVDNLMAVREGHHMKQWLIFFLHGVKETAHQSIALFEEILQMKERIEREVMPRFSSRRQDKAQYLIRHLYGQPIIDVKELARLLETTPNTAGALIIDFVKAGVLVEMTGQSRNRLFLFRDYVNLFSRRAA